MLKKCLSIYQSLLQVAALSVGPEHDAHFDNLYKHWIGMLVHIIPQNTDVAKAYESAASAEDQDFVQDLALFFTAFFKVQGLPLSRQLAGAHIFAAKKE
jgi:exportin-1